MVREEKDATLLALKVLEGTTSQGMWVTSRVGNDSNRAHTRVSKNKLSPADNLISSQ